MSVKLITEPYFSLFDILNTDPDKVTIDTISSEYLLEQKHKDFLSDYTQSTNEQIGFIVRQKSITELINKYQDTIELEVANNDPNANFFSYALKEYLIELTKKIIIDLAAKDQIWFYYYNNNQGTTFIKNAFTSNETDYSSFINTLKYNDKFSADIKGTFSDYINLKLEQAALKKLPKNLNTDIFNLTTKEEAKDITFKYEVNHFNYFDFILNEEEYQKYQNQLTPNVAMYYQKHDDLGFLQINPKLSDFINDCELKQITSFLTNSILDFDENQPEKATFILPAIKQAVEPLANYLQPLIYHNSMSFLYDFKFKEFANHQQVKLIIENQHYNFNNQHKKIEFNNNKKPLKQPQFNQQLIKLNQPYQKEFDQKQLHYPKRLFDANNMNEFMPDTQYKNNYFYKLYHEQPYIAYDPNDPKTKSYIKTPVYESTAYDAYHYNYGNFYVFSTDSFKEQKDLIRHALSADKNEYENDTEKYLAQKYQQTFTELLNNYMFYNPKTWYNYDIKQYRYGQYNLTIAQPIFDYNQIFANDILHDNFKRDIDHIIVRVTPEIANDQNDLMIKNLPYNPAPELTTAKTPAYYLLAQYDTVWSFGDIIKIPIHLTYINLANKYLITKYNQKLLANKNQDFLQFIQNA